MRIYDWEDLMLRHYAYKSCDQNQCEGGHIILIFHVTFREYMFKGLCEFMGGSPSR